MTNVNFASLSASISIALSSASLAACGGDDPFATNSCSDVATTCVQIGGGDVDALQNAVNSVEPNTTIILGSGRFVMTNSLTIRTDGIHLIGQGIDETTLDYAETTAQVNGVDVQSDDFLVQDLTVLDAPKDGIRVEDSDGVVFRRIRTSWTAVSDPTNGAYGIYPVKSKRVLVEDSRAENASDAGLYVGQCEHVIVRNNVVAGNVAGLEIENTQYADVYGNTAEDNTAGIVVFDLPGNPIVGRDVKLRDNIIRNNNHINFAPGGTVAVIPVGTGTFAMASRRVEITGNTYENNNTGDIALLSGLIVESDEARWELATASLNGTWEDLGLAAGATAGTITNFRSENIVVANNTHSGSGTMPDTLDPMMFGVLLVLVYGTSPIDNILYDTIGETSFHSTDATMNTNDNHICVGGNTGGTFASMNVEVQSVQNIVPFFRPAAPFAPFECTTLNGGPVVAPTL
ncbi:MAG: right-handed parallel beta-helix repeat-containing protein [Deltaproteobacteria bacterium]|nr:right-handed parallel beta-helix repeat-containing protein [Kofleriaceae bacterium]